MSARFVVDNSVVMGGCFENEGNRYAEAVLESLETGRLSRFLLFLSMPRRYSVSSRSWIMVRRFLTPLTRLP